MIYYFLQYKVNDNNHFVISHLKKKEKKYFNYVKII